MTIKSLLSYTNISDDSFDKLIEASELFYNRQGLLKSSLSGKMVGTLFTVTSTRTRTSFCSAALKLGANVMNFGPNDLQLKTGETFEDTGIVLANYIDIMVMRTNSSLNDMKSFSKALPTINAMSNCEHPSQILGDYITMQEYFKRKNYFEIAYFGEGNNTASAMAYFFCRLPNMKISFYMPKAYSLSESVIEMARGFATKSGSVINVFNEIPTSPEKVDIIYTTRWQTMGVMHSNTNWKDDFQGFRVDRELFRKFSKSEQSVFMHDLPAIRGEEVTSEILDGAQSIAFRQAYHKLTSAAGTLLWALT